MEESKHPNSALELQCVRVRVRVRACVRTPMAVLDFKAFPSLVHEKSVFRHVAHRATPILQHREQRSEGERSIFIRVFFVSCLFKRFQGKADI